MTGAPDNAPPLRLLFWESTSRCNLACVHCRRQDTAEADAASDLTTDEVEAVFDSAAEIGRPILVFSGGEPLMRDDWEPLAEHARGLGLPTALATNGTLIDGPLAGRICAAGFRRVSVSLDGADAVTHDRFRGVEGAFEKALAGIAALRASGQAVQINATIARHNVEQLPDLLALARDSGAEALHLFLLVPVGCGVQLADSHVLPPERQRAVLEWICDRQAAGDAGLELKPTCAPQYIPMAARRGLLPKDRPVRGCLSGRSIVFVGHAGDVFPCGYLPIFSGSVRQQRLANIWRRARALADLRDPDKLGGACGRCEDRAVCGGCRARAHAATGDCLAADPGCFRPADRDVQVDTRQTTC